MLAKVAEGIRPRHGEPRAGARGRPRPGDVDPARGCSGRHPRPRAGRDPGALARRDDPSSSTPRGAPRRGCPGADQSRRWRLLTVSRLRAAGRARTWWTMSPFDSTRHDVVRVPGTRSEFRGARRGCRRIRRRPRARRWDVTVTAAGQGLVERARDVLADAGVAPTIAQASVDAGSRSPSRAIALIAEAEFYGRAAAVDSGQSKKLASGVARSSTRLQLKTGRLRRARDARHRALRRDHPARGRVGGAHRPRAARYGPRRRSTPRVPRARVRGRASGVVRPTGCACRWINSICSAATSAGEAPPCRRWADPTGRPRRARRARRQSVRASPSNSSSCTPSDGERRACVRTRHPLAARARGGVPYARRRPVADDR